MIDDLTVWRVGEFISSARRPAHVLMLAVGEAQVAEYAAHRDFVRWVASSDVLPLITQPDRREAWAMSYPKGMTLQDAANELSDYAFMLTEVPKVYMHVTAGRLSKTNYHASAVIGVADELQNEAIEDALAEAREDATPVVTVYVDGSMVHMAWKQPLPNGPTSFDLYDGPVTPLRAGAVLHTTLRLNYLGRYATCEHTGDPREAIQRLIEECRKP